jgi:transposase
MEKCYMRRLIEQHPPSQSLRTIGIDEISVRKGHTYAIVVADLDQWRFRTKPAIDSDPIRPPIPIEIGH